MSKLTPRQLAALSSVPVAAFDAAGQLLYACHGAAALLGRVFKSGETTSLSAYLNVDQGWTQGFLDLLSTQRYWSGQAECRSQSGDALIVGINAFLLRDAPESTFLALLRPASKAHVDESAIAVLDLRWQDVRLLQLMSVGLSNKEIAEALAVGLASIGGHVKLVLAKLNAESRTGAAIKALRMGLVV